MNRVVASDDPMIDVALLDAELDAVVVAAETGVEAGLIEAGRGANALVVDVNTPVTETVLEALEELEIVARAGVGIDNVDVRAAAENGVTVTNVPNYCTNEVAAHTVALLLDCVRNLTGYDRDVKAGNWSWDRSRPLYRLEGRTLGLVSYGPIARRVRERVRGFDLEVVAYDPYVDADEMSDDGVKKVELDALYARADYVSLHAPLTDGTRGMIDEAALDEMQEHAVLVNTGRGGLIDEAALATALENDDVAAAGLDVLRTEPPDPDNPLVPLDNCILTPHAGWYSIEAREDLNATVAANVRAAFAGETPPDRIDPATEWL